MDRHIQILLNRVSCGCITIATLTLIILFLQVPETCVDFTSLPHLKPQHRFPRSTCDYSHRVFVSLEKHNKRLWASNLWTNAVHSYTGLFKYLHDNNLLFNHSRALVNSAGPGQAVKALTDLGLTDVTGVELVDSPPLVSRADPHSLPFFEGVFDFGFSPFLDRALFPGRYIGEMERTITLGGVCAVAIEECGQLEVDEIVKLFKKSRFMNAMNVTLAGEKMTTIFLKVATAV